VSKKTEVTPTSGRATSNHTGPCEVVNSGEFEALFAMRASVQDVVRAVRAELQGLERSVREQHRQMLAYQLEVQQSLFELQNSLQAVLRERPGSSAEGLRIPEVLRQRSTVVEQVHAAILSVAATSNMIFVVSRGDVFLCALPGVNLVHFPSDVDGTYLGYHPRDDAHALEMLEDARRRGGQHLVFPASSHWWLSHYSGLRMHLEANHRAVFSTESVGTIYELDPR
jgi:hypothetical protein